MSPKASPKTSLDRMDEILEKALKALKLEENFKVYPIWKHWSNVVGPTVSQKTHPDYVLGDTLYVSVVNSVWLHELEIQKRELLEKIQALKLEYPIQNIRFRIQKE